MSNLLWRITKQLFIFGAACFTFLILVVIGSMYWDMYQENKVLGMSAAISPTPIPTFTLTPTPTAKIQKKAYVAPVKDTDPAVHCQRHPNCGGGSIPLKQSECSNMTCCGNHDGTWKFVPKNQCNNGGSSYSPQKEARTYTYPTSAQSISTTTLIPTINAQQAGELLDSIAKDIENCKYQALLNFQSRYRDCISMYGSGASPDNSVVYTCQVNADEDYRRKVKSCEGN